MISRTHRFHGHNSLNYVYSRGKQVKLPDLGLKTAVNTRRQTYRAAVVVSKKISKSAVVRNRIRRRLYEAVRLSESRINQPFDLVFLVYSDKLITATGQEIETMVETLFKQADIN